MDSKGVQAGIMILVIGLQALHFASSGKTFDYVHFADDALGLSYTAYNSYTKTYSYVLGFAVAASALTALIYGVLLVVKLTGMNLSAKIQEVLFAGAAVLQFALAVVLGISQSRLTDPNGNNATAAQKITQYKDMFTTQLADTVLIWVICVPGTYILAHFSSDGASSSAKAQTSELGLRN